MKNRKDYQTDLIKKLGEAVQIVSISIAAPFQGIRRINLTSLLQVVCSFAILFAVVSLSHAQIATQKYSMQYDDGLLTLSAKKASLKGLLSHLAEVLNVYISYPRDLDKKITIKLSDVPPIKALRRILKSQNYALIYSASRPEAATAIAEIHILPEPVGRGASSKFRRQQGRGQQTLALIRNYEKKLERLRGRMAKTNKESKTGRNIRNQISSTEKTIERLKKSLER